MRWKPTLTVGGISLWTWALELKGGSGLRSRHSSLAASFLTVGAIDQMPQSLPWGDGLSTVTQIKPFALNLLL